MNLSSRNNLNTSSYENLTHLERIELELLESQNFQNSISGVLAFGFALACLSLNGKIAVVASAVSLLMAMAVADICSPKLSRLYIELKEKPHKTIEDEEKILFIKNTFLTKLRYAPFLIGFSSLLATHVFKFAELAISYLPVT